MLSDMMHRGGHHMRPNKLHDIPQQVSSNQTNTNNVMFVLRYFNSIKRYLASTQLLKWLRK